MYALSNKYHNKQSNNNKQVMGYNKDKHMDSVTCKFSMTDSPSQACL